MQETDITRAIIEEGTKEIADYLENDVAIVGAGPAGLTAAYYLAKDGVKTAVFEKRLSIGGGIWGGGDGYPIIVVQKDALEILDELNVHHNKYNEQLYTASAIELACCLGNKAKKAGAGIFTLRSIEDIAVDEKNNVTGLVYISSSFKTTKLPIDPLTIKSTYIIDATGHDAEIAHILQKHLGAKLNTPKGEIIPQKPMYVEAAEQFVVDNTQEVYKNVYVAGMSVSAVYGGHRMGPVFGGMLKSGRKVAELIIKKK